MRSQVLVVTAVVWLAAPGTAAAQATFLVDAPAPVAADTELAALRAEYAAAANAGDAARISALYTADALSLPGEGVLLRGRSEIERYARESLATVPHDASVTLVPRHFSASGHMASETGTFTETRGDGKPGATGVYVAIYTREGSGAWRIAMEVRSRGRDRQVVSW